MKKILILLLFINSSLSFAQETCPDPSEVKPANFMSLTIYKAPDYQSRWFYDPKLKILSFMKAEATSEQLQECWYEAEEVETGKKTIVSLSPTILIAPELKDKHWHHVENDFHFCKESDQSDCPLQDGKRITK